MLGDHSVAAKKISPSTRGLAVLHSAAPHGDEPGHVFFAFFFSSTLLHKPNV